MMRGGCQTTGGLSRRFCEDVGGAAAVEFAMIASLLMTLALSGFDLFRLILADRDAKRAAMEMSQTLAACPSSDCVLNAGQALTGRQANAFLPATSLAAGWAYVSRIGDNIVVSFGNMTYLPADVEASAKTVLSGENDNGVCSLVTTRVEVVGLLNAWPDGAFGDKRYFLCTIQSKNVKVI